MSKPLMQTCAALVLSSVAAVAANPDCAPLPNDFLFCPAGTAWAEAEALPFSNGVGFDLPPYWLEVMVAPDEVAQAPSLVDALAALKTLLATQARNEGLGEPQEIGRDAFTVGDLEAVTLTTRIDLPEDDPMLFVTMIAGQGDNRLYVTLDDAAGDVDALVRRMRDIAGLFVLQGE